MASVSNNRPAGEQKPHTPTEEEMKKAALELATFLYDLYIKERRSKNGSAKG